MIPKEEEKLEELKSIYKRSLNQFISDCESHISSKYVKDSGLYLISISEEMYQLEKIIKNY